MTLEAIRAILGWTAILNFVFLTFFFLVFVCAHDLLFRMHQRWFRISPQTFDAILYAAMAWYKLSIFLFFVAPYLALRFFF